MIRPRFLLMSASVVAALAAALWIGASGVRADGADYVRWDIINVTVPFSPTPPITTITSGGVAFALADANLKIQFTGSGTFIAPTSGGESSAVTGGGTWETFDGATSTGSGTYEVTRLVSWQFANFQLPITTDLIGPNAANGNAILRIRYSDGSEGVLGVGCHGPGAPAGIQEGVIATKGYFTYWTAPAPLPTVNANRTSFHILR
jgi:hypothetical protein